MIETLVGLAIMLVAFLVFWYIGKLYNQYGNRYPLTGLDGIIDNIMNGALSLLVVSIILCIVGIIGYMCYKLGYLILH